MVTEEYVAAAEWSEVGMRSHLADNHKLERPEQTNENPWVLHSHLHLHHKGVFNPEHIHRSEA